MFQSDSVTNYRENPWLVLNKELLKGAGNRSKKRLKAATAQASSPVAAMVRVTSCWNESVLDAGSDNCSRSSLNSANPRVMCQFRNSELSSPRAQINFPILKEPANAKKNAAYKLAPFRVFLSSLVNIKSSTSWVTGWRSFIFGFPLKRLILAIIRSTIGIWMVFFFWGPKLYIISSNPGHVTLNSLMWYTSQS